MFLTLLLCFAQLPGPAGYSLPILDLDGDTHRQVIVDREAGQYLGHVTTTLLDDGKTLIAVYPKGHGKGAIVMKRSEDGGRTWSERLEVPDNWSTSQEVPTIYSTVDPAGKKHLILFSGLAPIRLAHSEDDGQTWSNLEPIGDFGGIVACATMMRLKNGDYLAMFHDDGRFLGAPLQPQDSNPFHVYQIRSKDGGLTWSAPQVAATHRRAHLCEPLILRSPNGEQLLCLMRENSRQYNSFYMTSEDEGSTWSKPQQLSAALTGDRHTGTYAPDGRLFLSFRDTARRSPTQGDWIGWVGTYSDIVNGREGQYRVRLKDNKHLWDCAYPGVNLLPDGTFVCTTYGHWDDKDAPYILSVRIQLTELDELLGAGNSLLANLPNPATTPEARDGWWMDRHRAIEANVKLAAAQDPAAVDLLFIGDSITQGWEGAGKEIWAENYSSPRTALNFGIGGDRTQHVLWRLAESSVLNLTSKVAVVMIGTNNSNTDSGADIADGIFAILRELRAKQPNMHILLLLIFPRGADAEDALRKVNDDANRRIAIAADDPMIEVLDLSSVFLDADGKLPPAIMPDFLHPQAEGYRRWAAALEPKLQELGILR